MQYSKGMIQRTQIEIYFFHPCLALDRRQENLSMWGAILCWKGHISEMSGSAQGTLKKREMIALQEIIKKLKKPCEIKLFSFNPKYQLQWYPHKITWLPANPENQWMQKANEAATAAAEITAKIWDVFLYD